MRASSLLALALVLGVAHPQTAIGQSFNGGAAVAVHGPSYRIPVAVAAQPDSGALVVTVDFRTGLPDMYAQRVDRHGRPTLAAGGVLITAWDVNEAVDRKSVV